MAAVVIDFPLRPAPVQRREPEEMVTVTIRKELWLTLRELAGQSPPVEIPS